MYRYVLLAAMLLVSVSGFAQSLPDPIVFVQRQINTDGSVFYTPGKDMAGVGARSRFRKAAPGKLLIRETSGQIRTLIDGANPTAASLNLIDVNAPDVSFDGTTIIFAGLPSGAGGANPLANPGQWCIYKINVDGTGLTRLTQSTDLLGLDYSQFNGIVNGVFNGRYDDNDPAWLPDGRIVFSSTRWPVISQYSAASGTNLYVMNADGSAIHRITAERNGADRPVVDPTTGKIVYSRWWRNYRFPINDEQLTIRFPFSGSFCDCVTSGGITANRSTEMDGSIFFGDFMNRNGWQIAEINPDGTGLRMFAGDPIRGREAAEDANHGYGGGFASDGTFYANFFPMRNMSEASGFGGIRRYRRGPGAYTPIIGVTTRDEAAKITSDSFGVQQPPYAGEATVLLDGRLLISWAADTNQQYGLYVINADGSGRTLVYDNATTAELRAKVVKSRPVPPIIPDSVSLVAALLPPLETPPYDIDGTYQFAALNVYGNAPVDWNIPSAIPVGSAARIKFFLDHQRKSYGSFSDLDFPILIKEEPISAGGRVIVDSPANVQLFEQIRGNVPGMPIPFFGPPYPGSNPANYYVLPGAAHVAGQNFGRPGQVQRCIGCHAGHSMIPVPATDAEAEWSNLAPGATGVANALIDRRSSSSSSFTAATLTFPVSVKVRRVMLWGASSTQAAVRLYSDAGATTQVAQASGSAAAGGGSIAFTDVVARSVRVTLTAGTSLQEIEVIATGNLGSTPPPPPAACADSLDNDGDGLVDLADPGCTSASDTDEFNEPPPPPPVACADGLDNDGDGLIDFPSDPGCTSSADADEFNAPPPAICADGLDNDSDGLIDYPNDLGCSSATDEDETNTPPPAQITISSLTLNKSSVRYGQFARGTVLISGPAPASGIVVTLTSSNTGLAQVPASITVTAGSTGQTFQVATERNPDGGRITRQVIITASVNGVTKSVTLTLTN